MAIFGATASKKSRVFQAGAATATIGSVPAMLLGVTIQVQRSMSPIPTLTDGIVWSAQPVQGTLQAQSILTTDNSGDFIKNIAEGDACSPIPCSVKMKDAACDSRDINLNIEDGYCSAVSFAIQGSQGYIGNDFTIQFTVCKIS
jgi:hypothetical protein